VDISLWKNFAKKKLLLGEHLAPAKMSLIIKFLSDGNSAQRTFCSSETCCSVKHLDLRNMLFGRLGDRVTRGGNVARGNFIDANSCLGQIVPRHKMLIGVKYRTDIVLLACICK